MSSERPDEIEITILLPLTYNDGTPVERYHFLKTRKELTARFGGCTALVPTEGSWINKDREYRDVNSGFYVIAPKTEETIRFLKEYKETLKERFKQIDIMITWQDIKRI